MKKKAYYECPKCQMRSFNPKDLEHKYCGYCQEFEENMRLTYEDLTYNERFLARFTRLWLRIILRRDLITWIAGRRLPTEIIRQYADRKKELILSHLMDVLAKRQDEWKKKKASLKLVEP